MSQQSISYSRSISLPMVKGIHEVLEAFCRTSVSGVWTRDNKSTNDLFQMSFIRGNWRWSAFFRILPYATVSFDGKGIVDRSTRPAKLVLLIRPTPDSIKLVIRHEIFLISHDEQHDKGTIESLMTDYDKFTRDEAYDLLKYVREWYELNELLEVEETYKKPSGTF